MKTVVIVEDEKDARENIKQYLSGYHNLTLLYEYENGRDAVPRINGLRPDIILLDVHLPGLNGFQVAERLVYKPAIIITTGYEDYALKAFDHDVVDYLLKPFSADRFDMAVVKALQFLYHQAEPSL